MHPFREAMFPAAVLTQRLIPEADPYHPLKFGLDRLRLKSLIVEWSVY